MNQTMAEPLDLVDLRALIADELAARRCDNQPGGYAPQRGAAWSPYGTIGAAHVFAGLGLTLGTTDDRRRWAGRLLACRGTDGTLLGGDSGPEHGLCMMLACLHLLGESIPARGANDPGVAPLAPLDPRALRTWMDSLDWTSTHKPFWGMVTPVLASGLGGRAWVRTLLDGLASRIDPARPLEIWCAADDQPWKVISSVYHITSALDAGRLVYPHADLLLDRMLDLRWEDAADDARRTDCTDGDWAWLLMRLAEMRHQRRPDVVPLIRKVSARRIRRFRDDPQSVLGLGTFFIYCWLWCTAVFQDLCRDHYAGPYLRDTLNDPALFRLA